MEATASLLLERLIVNKDALVDVAITAQGHEVENIVLVTLEIRVI